MKFKKINLNSLFGSTKQNGEAYPCNSTQGATSCKDNALREGNNNGARGQRAKSYNGMNDYGNNEIRWSSGTDAVRKEGAAPTRCTGENMRDRGNEPIVFDIRKEAFLTPDFRVALWTGGNLQLTVMTIPVGEETGIERHEGIDQLVGVVSGAGEVLFGNRENYFATPVPLDAHSVILIPAGTYHNIRNVGRTPLKLYSVYAPKAHKFGTVDISKTD